MAENSVPQEDVMELHAIFVQRLMPTENDQ